MSPVLFNVYTSETVVLVVGGDKLHGLFEYFTRYSSHAPPYYIWINTLQFQYTRPGQSVDTNIIAITAKTLQFLLHLEPGGAQSIHKI